MKTVAEKNSNCDLAQNPGRHIQKGTHSAICDLLIARDGTILVHNLTPAMAGILETLNPQDPAIRLRSLSVAETGLRGPDNQSPK